MPTTWNSVLDPGEHAGEQLEQQAHERARARARDDGGDPPVDALALPEPVEDEGGDGGDGAVGEVEDARGLVGEDEPGARQAVDGPGGQTDHDERKQIVHAADTPHFVVEPHETAVTVTPNRASGSDSQIARVVHRTVTAGDAPVNRARLAARINRVH